MDKSKWEYKKLGDIALVSAGQGAPQGDNNYSSEGTPFVKAGNIESLVNGLSEYEIQKVNDEVVKSHRLKLYKAGSVLFAKSGMSCMKGLVYTLKNDCYVVSHLAIVTPQNINSHYLNYYFQVHKPNSLIKDSAYPSISLKDIENMIVLCPSHTDQQRIVAELDCLNEMIAVKQEQLKEFDKLAQSIFYDMFGDPVLNEKGWEKRSYKDFGEVIGGYAFKSEMFVDLGVPVLKIGNINSGELKLEGICYYPYTPSLEKYEVHAGDLVMSLTGTTGKDDYGNICVIPNNAGTFYLNQRNAILKPNAACNKTFLQFVFKQNFIKEELTKNCRGVRQANILNKDILSLQIILPLLSLQQQFAEKISAIEAQKELVKQSIAETQHLLDYTMDKYFGYD